MPDLESDELPEFRWNKDDAGQWSLTVDEEVEEALDEFFEKPDKRFFVAWLLIVGDPASHANLLIFDRFANEWELWEPHGYEFAGSNPTIEAMYKALRAWIVEKADDGLLP
ncbi:MAG: hypothetical protein EB015_22870, partial [Methylocystaceae bacterium]|nr:hypothetical protein [Methylocystaceae bacterium]